jgi:protein TonB
VSVAKAILFFVCAAVVHAAVLLFGGILFLGHGEAQASKRDVEVVTESVEKEKEKQEEKQEEKPEEEIDAKEEAPPDPESVQQPVEPPSGGDDAPALDAASLSAIEAALNGDAAAGGGDFGGSQASLQGGGRIGGTGRPGSAGGEGDEFAGAFSMSEIDQRPRAVYQVGATYPQELRAQKAEGSVTLIFVVDETGRVVNPRVEKSTHREFEAPALEALRQWKFEPAVKAGKRVGCRMRVPIRFQPR